MAVRVVFFNQESNAMQAMTYSYADDFFVDKNGFLFLSRNVETENEYRREDVVVFASGMWTFADKGVEDE